MNDAFSSYHPFIIFLYFSLVVLLAMFLMHPVCLLISMLCAGTYAVMLKGASGARFGLRVLLPTMLIAALVNPAFNHEGATILMYLPGGNPLTLESIFYGLAAAVMLVTVMGWFACCNMVLSSDKFIYLFGRIIPGLSLVLSMVMRFLPLFKTQLMIVINAQKTLGRDLSHGSIIKRIRHGVTILSIMTTWALENAIETADSMKSRGYGLEGRTAFSIYRFDRRDRLAAVFIAVSTTYIISGATLGGLYYRYMPTVKLAPAGAWTVSLLAAYLVLCSLPVVINIWEDRKWKLIQSRT